jgi:hypothetical protein
VGGVFQDLSALVGIRPFSGKDGSLGHIQRDFFSFGTQKNFREEDSLLPYAAQAPLRSEEFYGATDPRLAKTLIENGDGFVPTCI